MQGQLAEEMQGFLQALFASTFDAATILNFTQRLGADFAGSVPGNASRQHEVDPYKVLGLDRSSAEECVRRRYRDLLRKVHPDTAGVEGTEFLTVVKGVLVRRENLTSELAEEIARRLDGRSQDVRDAIRVARLAPQLGAERAIALLLGEG